MVLAGGFAAAVVVAPAVAMVAATGAPTQTISACPGGESEDTFTTVCVPDLVPNSPEPFSAAPGNPQIPEVSGIPCAGHNSGQCVGLAEDQSLSPQMGAPQSTVSFSP
jgi:hypothetical protein